MKVAIITGATSGMGQEMVKMVMRQERSLDEIWLLARRKDRLEKMKNCGYPGKIRTFAVDLVKKEDRETFYQALSELSPEITIFIHAAGFGIMGQIAEIPREEQEEMVELNVTSYVSMTSHLLPYMVAGGRMIYFASASAFLPQPGFAVYAASKAFVLSYVRSLRAESRHLGLRITAVCPGAVKTEFFERAAVSQKLPFYKQLVMADPKKVVKKAWKDNKKGREISVYGIFMQAFFLLTKLLPHRCFLHFMGGRSNTEKRQL